MYGHHQANSVYRIQALLLSGGAMLGTACAKEITVWTLNFSKRAGQRGDE
jgi:hypothetical protein